MKRLENAAHQLLLSLRQTQTLLIINDHIDIAKRVGADGVHLGQDDMGCHEARLRLGPNSVIGVSTHNLSEIDKAIADGANYVGFGPVFPTDTKTDTHLVQGVQQLRDAVAQSSIPVIAIGGITVANVQQVQAAGAFGWAVISDLFENGDPSAIVEKFSQSALSFRGTSE